MCATVAQVSWPALLGAVAGAAASSSVSDSRPSKGTVDLCRDAFALLQQCVSTALRGDGERAAWGAAWGSVVDAVSALAASRVLWEQALPCPLDLLRSLATRGHLPSASVKDVAVLLLQRAKAVCDEKEALVPTAAAAAAPPPPTARHHSACSTELSLIFSVLEAVAAERACDTADDARVLGKPLFTVRGLARQALALFPTLHRDNRKEFCDFLRVLVAVVRARGASCFHALCVSSPALLHAALTPCLWEGKPDRCVATLCDLLLSWMEVSNRWAHAGEPRGESVPPGLPSRRRPVRFQLHPDDALLPKVPTLCRLLLNKRSVEAWASVYVDSGVTHPVRCLAAAALLLASPDLHEDRIRDVLSRAETDTGGPPTTLWQALLRVVCGGAGWDMEDLLSSADPSAPLPAALSTPTMGRARRAVVSGAPQPADAAARCAGLYLLHAVYRLHPAAVTARSDLKAVLAAVTAELSKPSVVAVAPHDVLLDVIMAAVAACVECGASPGSAPSSRVAVRSVGSSSLASVERDVRAFAQQVQQETAGAQHLHADRAEAEAVWQSALQSLLTTAVPTLWSLHGSRADSLAQRALRVVHVAVSARLVSRSGLRCLLDSVWKLPCFRDSSQGAGGGTNPRLLSREPSVAVPRLLPTCADGESVSAAWGRALSDTPAVGEDMELVREVATAAGVGNGQDYVTGVLALEPLLGDAALPALDLPALTATCTKERRGRLLVHMFARLAAVVCDRTPSCEQAARWAACVTALCTEKGSPLGDTVLSVAAVPPDGCVCEVLAPRCVDGSLATSGCASPLAQEHLPGFYAAVSLLFVYQVQQCWGAVSRGAASGLSGYVDVLAASKLTVVIQCLLPTLARWLTADGVGALTGSSPPSLLWALHAVHPPSTSRRVRLQVCSKTACTPCRTTGVRWPRAAQTRWRTRLKFTQRLRSGVRWLSFL